MATVPTFETAGQIGKRFQLPTSAVLRLHRLGKIPGIRMGFRTIRFDPAAVMIALASPQTGEGESTAITRDEA